MYKLASACEGGKVKLAEIPKSRSVSDYSSVFESPPSPKAKREAKGSPANEPPKSPRSPRAMDASKRSKSSISLPYANGNSPKKEKKEEKREDKKDDRKEKKEDKKEKPKTEEPKKSPSKPVEKKKKSTGIKKTLKVVVVGDGAVGKTSVLVTYTTKTFPVGEYVPTIFDNYNSIEKCEDQEINLILWDTAGQEDLARIRTLNYPGTDCFIICYAVTSRDSFLNVKEKWLPEIKNYCPDACLILAGLKADMISRYKKDDPELVKMDEADKVSKTIGAAIHLWVSALENKNVQELFHEAMIATLSQQIKRKKKSRF